MIGYSQRFEAECASRQGRTRVLFRSRSLRNLIDAEVVKWARDARSAAGFWWLPIAVRYPCRHHESVESASSNIILLEPFSGT